ncbi:MAG TPA: glycoside hydrolase family 3 N-terminal domain-containing protein [Acidimicrobiia bacterium]|nr:glycoside hydrolase family 3 N-terminal domain-containing protein [Acidimicrobiia bacterium]
MRGDSYLITAFEGEEPPPSTIRSIAEDGIVAVTLFPHTNVGSADQVATLTESLHSSAPDGLPLLVAADQETGQLVGLGPDTTQFPGAMALGAVGDADLAFRVGQAVGTEMRALGVTVNYAPVCDVASNPLNPSLGIRAFSDDPNLVAELAAATIAGLKAAGVAATAKHFPGKGEAIVDPHHELPRLELDRARLEAVELVPFRAAVSAGVSAFMIGHYALPSVTGRDDLPTSLSEAAVNGLLRKELGFDGVVMTDALDMGALPQGIGQVVDAVAAVRAGIDLLLTTPDPEAQERLRAGLDLAVARGLIDSAEMRASQERVRRLRRWVAGFPRPDIAVVGSSEHQTLAAEVARRSITLVRDEPPVLPLAPTGSLLAVMPRPADLTPADTSSTVPPLLARALRRHHPDVEEIVTGHPPSSQDIAAVAQAAREVDTVVVGTLSAGPEQGALVEVLLETGKPVVSVALRTPFDLAAYPRATTHLCTYSILPPSMDALADVLFGVEPTRGRLPAAIPDAYPRGHGVIR